jgi:hypothetical protein
MTKRCDNCRREFFPRESKVRFCSPGCNQSWWTRHRVETHAAWKRQQAARAEHEDFICSDVQPWAAE